MFQKSSVYMQTFTFLYYQNSPDNPFLRLMVTQDGQNEEWTWESKSFPADVNSMRLTNKNVTHVLRIRTILNQWEQVMIISMSFHTYFSWETTVSMQNQTDFLADDITDLKTIACCTENNGHMTIFSWDEAI